MARNIGLARLSALLVATIFPAYGQFVGSGSNGSDGALILTSPGTVFFDQRSFSPPLNRSEDNIFQFTSIYIGKDVVVKLSAKLLGGPVFWLSQGPVQIDGTIDLDGAEGSSTPAIAGAGGYPGGLPHKPGYKPGDFHSNVFLVPLVGGSGGSGGETQGGGAGGGALLIASSVSITLNGAITANGGASSEGTGGSGGAIRLVAPGIGGSGVLSAKGGQPGGADGLVRFEASDNQFSGTLNNTPSAKGKPFGLFLPPGPPASVKVVSIDGVPVNGSEITLRKTSPALLVVEARSVPPGTVIQLEFFGENGTSQVISTTPLQGTFELSRATASVAFPSGLSHAQIEASWKQGPPKEGRDR
jgi:hypothetical protein